MQRSDYKSSLYYLFLQPSHSGLSFEDFLLHFSNKDIGKLDLAISETILRDAFYQRLGSFYNRNIITCQDEFKMIVNRNLSIEKCDAPNVSIGNCRYLEYLGIVDFVVNNEEAEQLLSLMLEHSPQLANICFKFITVKGLNLIATHCGPNLRSINTKVGDNSLEAIQSICRACPNLRDLSLRFIGDEPNSNELILTVVQCCPLIELLPSLRYITDVAMNALATINTLKQISVFSDNCTSAAVQRVLKSNPSLGGLVFHGSFIDDALVNCIGRSFGHLKRLTIGKLSQPALSDNNLVEVFRGCPLLESFHLLQPRRMSTAALRAMFEHCHHLIELGVFSGAMPEEPPLAGESVLHAHYPSLRKLKVRENGVADSTLQGIFTHCTSLSEIYLDSCSQITDESIRVLARSCASLSFIGLSDCMNLTNIGVLEVATHCTNLTTLDLTRMPVNDEVLIQLSLHCPNLTRLNLGNCKGGPVTEAGVLAIVEGCTGLTFLTIRGRNTVKSLLPTLDLTRLKQSYPHITFKIEP